MKRVLVLSVAAILAFAGCEQYKSDRGRGDAPIETDDDSGAYVTNFPNVYPNVATKCLHGANGLRVVVPSRADVTQGMGIVVVPDESC